MRTRNGVFRACRYGACRFGLAVVGVSVIGAGLGVATAVVASADPPWWVCIANGGQTRAFYRAVDEQSALDMFHDALGRLSSTAGRPPAHVDVCQLA